MTVSKNFIQVGDLIGEGQTRLVYAHSVEEDLCIKIMKDNAPEDVNMLEYNYYQTRINLKIKSSYIPQIYGWVDTDKGKGMLTEKIKNFEGKIAESIYNLVQSKSITKEEAVVHLNEIYDFFIKHNLIVSDINLHNYVLTGHKNQAGGVTIIDGLRPKAGVFNKYKYMLREYIPFYNYYKLEIARNKLFRILKKMKV